MYWDERIINIATYKSPAAGHPTPPNENTAIGGEVRVRVPHIEGVQRETKGRAGWGQNKMTSKRAK